MKHLKTFESFSNIDYTNEEVNILKGITNLVKGAKDLMKSAITVDLKDKPSEASKIWLKKSGYDKHIETYSKKLGLTNEQVEKFFRLYFDKTNKDAKVENGKLVGDKMVRNLSNLDISVEGDEITVKDMNISTSNPGTASR